LLMSCLRIAAVRLRDEANVVIRVLAE